MTLSMIYHWTDAQQNGFYLSIFLMINCYKSEQWLYGLYGTIFGSPSKFEVS